MRSGELFTASREQFFTAVPYPLTADAPAYYREFVGGGIRATLLTLIFGALAGGLAGLFRRPQT